MGKNHITVDQFKEQITSPDFKDKLPEDLIVVRSGSFQVDKSEQPDSLIRTFTMSTSDIDREGDRIMSDGWQIDNFKKGGSVLYGHDSRRTPNHVIGKPLDTWIEGNSLRSKIEFTPKEINPTGFMVWRMVDEGFLRSASVGFLPKKWKYVDDDESRSGCMPMDFVIQELLEESIVPVPANPNALSDAKGMGIDLAPLREWTQKAMDGEGVLLVERDLLEKTWKIIRPEKTIIDFSPQIEKLQKSVYALTKRVFMLEEPEIQEPEFDEKDIARIVRESFDSELKKQTQKVTGLID